MARPDTSVGQGAAPRGHSRRDLPRAIALVLVVLLASGLAHSAEPTVLITGSNRGIGLALARTYAAKGWSVLATCREPVQAAELHALAEDYPNVEIAPLDVTDDAQIQALATRYRGRPIDILINNAGILPELIPVRFDTIDYAKMDRVLAVNTWGVMKVSAAFIDNVAASDKKKIVTMTSGEGSLGRVRRSGAHYYRVSKVAVNMLMLLMSKEVADRGVIVGLINPGLVDTQGLGDVDLNQIPEAMRGPVESMRNSGRMQAPDAAAAKLASLIEGLKPEDSGVFYDISGSVLPW